MKALTHEPKDKHVLGAGSPLFQFFFLQKDEKESELKWKVEKEWYKLKGGVARCAALSVPNPTCAS